MEENKRWIVTYTKHIRQKRKVYQDGVLEHHCSSNKILLYADTGKLLDSRFLKKDDLVECGTTLTFESHLVDIGDLDETNKPLKDSKVSVSNGKSNEKTKIYGKISTNSFPVKKDQSDRHGSTNVYAHDTQGTRRGNKQSELQTISKVQNQPNLKSAAIREWNVLYTNQITQKAKRYHDGMLRLLSCGSHTNQLILLKEDGTILSGKFQKSTEGLSIGSTYELPNYLVEICHQHNMQGGLEEPKKNPPDKVVEMRSSGSSRFIKGDEVLMSKPLQRDAYQILSALRRPPQHSVVPANLLTNPARPPQSVDLFLSDPLDSGGALKSVTLSETPSDATKLVYPDCKAELLTVKQSASSSLLHGEEACKTSVTNLGLESTGKDFLELGASIIVSDTSANGSSGCICIKESLGSHTEEKPKLGCMSLHRNRLQIEELGDNAMCSQLHSDNMNSENEGSKGVDSSCAPTSGCVAAFPGIEDNEKTSELKTSPGKATIANEFPSFDLGVEL